MAGGIGKLGELFPDKQVACRIRGCDNLLRFSGEDVLRGAAKGQPVRENRMCEECFELFNSLEDAQVPCSTPDCKGTWTWNRFQQLENRRRGFDRAPRGYCDDCRKRMRELEDKEIPCRVRGCERTWTWTARQQAERPGAPPPRRMCRQCWEKLKDLEDRELPCRIRGCETTWTWSRYDQLELVAKGQSLDKPPVRMCRQCWEMMKTLEDKELPCKVDACERTWTWNSYAQVEHQRTHPDEPDAPPPSKMCRECYGFYVKARDREIRCRLRGCRNTWTYTRGMQLHDRLAGVAAPPPRLCEDCRTAIEAAESRQEHCMVPGCEKTWTYTPEEQVRDRVNNRPAAPKRRCETCTEFLANHQTRSIPCSGCDGTIEITAYQQLMCELGTFQEPTLCTQCASQKMAAGQPDPVVTRAHHHVVRMPSGGKWGSDPAIASWPPHLSHDTIARVEQADIRIVALGDDTVFSREDTAEAWPTRLEAMLNEQFADSAKTVRVVNAGIPGTTSAQALVRAPRDVLPFSPHLVIVSFLLADSMLLLDDHSGRWRDPLPADDADPMRDLLDRLTRRVPAVACAALGPVYAQMRVTEELDGRFSTWGDAQDHAFAQRAAHHVRLARERSIPFADFRPRFEVNGRRSARKWMSNWCSHNANGAEHIARWLREFLNSENLLPLESPPLAVTEPAT